MPKRQFYLFLLTLLLLISCSNNENGVSTLGDEARVLTLAVPEGTIATFRTLAEAFEEAHPGITVHVESMSRLTGDDPNPARALAQAADIFISGTAFTGDWQSLTLDLTPLANATDFDAADFPAGLLYAADGTIRHLPVTVDPSFVLYNKALFDNAGLAYPTPDWTWEEFVSLATQLTQRYGDFTAQYGWADGLQTNALVGAGLAGSLIDYNTVPPGPQLAGDDAAAALTRYLALFGENGVAPTPRSAASAYGETQTLIQERRVAMWLAAYTTLGSYRGLDVGVAPLPVVAGNAGQRLYVRTIGFAASAATQQPALAWQLIEYLSRQQGFGEELIPARASVRQATGFWEGDDPQVATVVEDYLDHSFELAYAGTHQALRQAAASVLWEETELAAALAAQETAVQQRLMGEAEPLAAVAGDKETTISEGRILFITDVRHPHRYQALAQAFEEENPGLRIEISAPQWTWFAGTGVQSLDRTRTGQQADCFVHSPLLTEAEVARVLPLDALLELEPDINRDDFYPFTLNAFLHDGALIALPEYFRLPLIGYDTTLFDAAGVPYPEMGWTLQEFLETAVALTAGEGRQKQYGYIPHIGDFNDAWLFLHAFGVDLLDHSVEPVTASFDTPAVADALRWYVALSETYGVKPLYHTNNYDSFNNAIYLELLANRRSLFAARRGAMWWDDGSEWEGPYATPTAAIEERRYNTFPVTPDSEVMLPAEVTGLYISAETEQRRACWQWITFLLEHDPGFGIPARRSVAHSEEFHLRVGPAANVMLQNAAQMSGRQLVQSPEWMNLRHWYSIALTRAIEEDMTAEEALSITQAEFEVYRQCVMEGELFARTSTHARQRLLECAAPASSYVILREE